MEPPRQLFQARSVAFIWHSMLVPVQAAQRLCWWLRSAGTSLHKSCAILHGEMRELRRL